eukprot:TRINITY_DN1107_c0_g1_i2.p1 TRINITY_DN1107_c0_g1~~TRINITY_DN1107_c0_g1_i2.p1  ORF type:complete len:144 (-),score=38.30 TRINITY_DN1107_c0_g1_i2:343-774(-)
MSQVLTQKRKREAYEAPTRQQQDDDEQFSSNVSHVLLAMAELREDEDVVSPVPEPQVDLVSQLLLQAESSKQEEIAQQGTTSDAAITPSPTLRGAAESDVSNGTSSLLDLLVSKPAAADAEATNQTMLESTLQAPVSPGVAIA